MARHKHIFLNDLKESLPYTSAQQGGGGDNIPRRHRRNHGNYLIRRLNEIWEEVEGKRESREAISLNSKDGIYLEFKSKAGFDLVTKSLEDIRQGVRLLNIRKVGEGENEVTIATVYVPKGKEQHFLKKIRAFATEIDSRSNKPKNQKLVNSIEEISLAVLESLWTDPTNFIPSTEKVWCEVWLRIDEEDTASLTDFKTQLTNLGIEHKSSFLSFPERQIILLKSNRADLTELIEQNNNLAEFRIGQDTARFWVAESNKDQVGWVEDLVARLNIVDTGTHVCVLDTGVNNGHSLLNPILVDQDCLTVNPTWGVNDHVQTRGGHGTLMAGLAGYGNLEACLASSGNIEVTHKLCSVKILPPDHLPQTDPELWGDITQQGVSQAEIRLPEAKLVFCMAVTSSIDVDRGRPSSWSGAIDKIVFSDNEKRKVFFVSGGNITEQSDWDDYPNSNIRCSILNPAQSWNAIAVGAYTDKAVVTDRSFAGHIPLARVGELSPFSSTSSSWEKSKWPIKPEIVFEGGNILRAPDGSLNEGQEDMGILSTSKNTITRQFDLINATSAATAQASWFAAKILAQYPNAWPETVRGLIIHSANWKDEMLTQFNIDLKKKSDVKKILRISGYGMPDLEKALYTTESKLTFVAQESIQPFTKRDGRCVTNHMHFYDLPWPKEDLLSLGETKVKVRITLSYFIEPGPGEIGWKDKYRYQSFALRFDMNSTNETEEIFKKRINRAVREEEEEIESESDSNRWLIGAQGRNLGSLHSDVWEGTAADIATCNLIAVYPVIGWWRQRTNLEKWDSNARYSLIVSLETPPEVIDIYAPIVAKIQTPITINTNNS